MIWILGMKTPILYVNRLAVGIKVYVALLFEYASFNILPHDVALLLEFPEFYNDIDLLTAWNSLSYAGSNDLSQMTSVPFNQSEGHGSEAELDTQYITATGPGIPTYVYYTNGMLYYSLSMLAN